MKTIKKITLFIGVALIVLSYFNENTINTFAESYSKQSFSVGEIYKSGDVINKLKTNGFPGRDGETYNYIMSYIKAKETCNLDEVIDSNNNLNTNCIDYIDESEFNSDVGCKETYTFKQMEGKDVYFKVVHTDYDNHYGVQWVYLAYFDYNEPKLEIKCKDEKIKENEFTECELDLKYNYEISELDFKLNSDIFKISNFKTVENYKVNFKDENNYVIKNDNIDFNKKEERNIKIGTFTLMAPQVEKTTNLKDNIQITNIKYTDSITSDNLENTNTTLNVEKVEIPKEEPKEPDKIEKPKQEIKKEEVVENPTTGVNYPILISIIALIAGVTLIKVSKKHKLFRRL